MQLTILLLGLILVPGLQGMPQRRRRDTSTELPTSEGSEVEEPTDDNNQTEMIYIDYIIFTAPPEEESNAEKDYQESTETDFGGTPMTTSTTSAPVIEVKKRSLSEKRMSRDYNNNDDFEGCNEFTTESTSTSTDTYKFGNKYRPKRSPEDDESTPSEESASSESQDSSETTETSDSDKSVDSGDSSGSSDSGESSGSGDSGASSSDDAGEPSSSDDAGESSGSGDSGDSSGSGDAGESSDSGDAGESSGSGDSSSDDAGESSGSDDSSEPSSSDDAGESSGSGDSGASSSDDAGESSGSDDAGESSGSDDAGESSGSDDAGESSGSGDSGETSDSGSGDAGGSSDTEPAESSDSSESNETNGSDKTGNSETAEETVMPGQLMDQNGEPVPEGLVEENGELVPENMYQNEAVMPENEAEPSTGSEDEESMTHKISNRSVSEDADVVSKTANENSFSSYNQLGRTEFLNNQQHLDPFIRYNNFDYSINEEDVFIFKEIIFGKINDKLSHDMKKRRQKSYINS